MALGLPPGWLRDTAALYARVFRRGAELALRNWWVGLVVIVYSVLLGVVAVVTAPLGLVGGLLAYLAPVACFSSWLALVAQVIHTGRIRLAGVPTRWSRATRSSARTGSSGSRRTCSCSPACSGCSSFPTGRSAYSAR